MGSKRRRRSAEQARADILDAAERQLHARGPNGIRLQELAAELEVSHPAILHHFGSKEGLVTAVVNRAITRLERHIVTTLTTDDVDENVASSLMARVVEVLQDEGHARVLAWLALSPRADQLPLGDGEPRLRLIADVVHRLRREAHSDAPPPYEDSLFTVVLATAAILGDSIAGPRLRASAGLSDDPDARARFHRWLARMLVAHLERAS